jgi:hemolysin activation/secretion protein
MNGWKSGQAISTEPYTFYDIGAVWNKGHEPQSYQSGASAGFGLRATTSFGLSGNFGLAFPLTREISDPVYGGGHKGPRILLQVSQGF